MAVRCDNRLFQHRQITANRRTVTRYETRQNQATDTATSRTQTGGNSATTRKLSEQERTRRMTNNLCLYCGEHGHRARNCSNRGQRLNLAVHEVDNHPENQSCSGVNPASLYLSAASSNNHKPLVVSCRLNSQKSRRVFRAMIDSGATGCFIQKGIARIQPRTAGPEQTSVTLADGSRIPQRQLGYTFMAKVHVYGSIAVVSFLEVDGLGEEIILGMPWLAAVNPCIEWRTRRLHSPVHAVATMQGTSSSVPPEYSDFGPVFERATADRLPAHTPHDCAITLKEGEKLPFGPIYSMSYNELTALRTYLDDNLAKGFIRQSTLPVASPVLFVRKKDGRMRLCVDYRAVNRAL